MADFRPPDPPPSELPPAEPESRGPTMTVDELLRRMTPRAWLTPAILVLLVCVYVASVLGGPSLWQPTDERLRLLGAGTGSDLVRGEWWRLVLPMLLHVNLLHLGVNVWALWSFGPFVERLFGNAAYVAIWLLTGVGASLLSIAVHPLASGVGASGALFGVVGALAGFVLTHRGVLPQAYLAAQRKSIFGFLVTNIAIGLAIPRIDVAAHAGGFVVGLAAGVGLSRDLLRPGAHRLRRALTVVVLAALLVLASVGLVLWLRADPEVRDAALEERAYQHVARFEYERAVPMFDELLDRNRTAPRLYARGYARAGVGDTGGAWADFEEAYALEASQTYLEASCDAAGRTLRGQSRPEAAMLARASRACALAVQGNPDSAELLSMRALVAANGGKLDEAAGDLERAKSLAPSATWIRELSALIAFRRGELDAAERDCAHALAAPKAGLQALTVCATVALRRGAGEAALERANRAVRDFPGELWSYHSRAQVHAAAGQTSLARSDLDKGVELAPGDANAFNNRAWFEVAAGDFATAKADADRALALAPDLPLALGTRCFALVGLGDLAAARRDCARSVELDPDAAVDRAMLDFLDGKKAKAAEAWRAATEKDPSNARMLEPWIEKARAR